MMTNTKKENSKNILSETSLFLFLFAIVLLALLAYGSEIAGTALAVSIAFKSFLKKYIWFFLYDSVKILIVSISTIFIGYIFLKDRNKVSFVANQFLRL